MKAVLLGGDRLTARDVADVAERGRSVRLDEGVRARVDRGRALVDRAIDEGRVVYGIDTGFGDLAQVAIPADDLAALQLNLIRSHASGAGEPLDEAAVRAILLAKANDLVQGHEGVRNEIPVTLVAFLERGIYPVVPAAGSVGASGDLAPLAHLSLPLVGEGEVFWKGERVPAAWALEKAGIPPLTLEPKEGLGLINGTQGMSGILALAVDRLKRLLDHAEIAAALSIDALHGTDAAFDRRLFEVRPHPGGVAVAARLRALLAGSEIRESHRHIPKTQDAYSIRCVPAVLGAVRDVLDTTRTTVERELGASTGNPLCFPDEGDILSGGNFHGEPVAFAADFLAIAAAEVASIAERRVARLVDPKLSGLSPYLARDPGLHSGYMVAQYSAAALVSENKVLCHPASVDSIPTSGNQEDHVSMGFHGARQARQVVGNLANVVAIELITAAHAVELHSPLRTSPPLESAIAAIREVVAPLEEDRPLTQDLEAVLRRIDDGAILTAVENTIES